MSWLIIQGLGSYNILDEFYVHCNITIELVSHFARFSFEIFLVSRKNSPQEKKKKIHRVEKKISSTTPSLYPYFTLFIFSFNLWV